MEKPIKPGRITALACMLTLLVIVFVVALYKLQICLLYTSDAADD